MNIVHVSAYCQVGQQVNSGETIRGSYVRSGVTRSTDEVQRDQTYIGDARARFGLLLIAVETVLR